MSSVLEFGGHLIAALIEGCVAVFLLWLILLLCEFVLAACKRIGGK